MLGWSKKRIVQHGVWNLGYIAIVVKCINIFDDCFCQNYTFCP